MECGRIMPKKKATESRDLVYVKARCDSCGSEQFFSLKSRKCDKCNAPRPEQNSIELIDSAIKEAG